MKEKEDYGNLRSIVKRLGGRMVFHRKGYRHGAWEISLGRKNWVLESTGMRRLPALDRFYKPLGKDPKTWDDYTDELLDDGEDRFIAWLKGTEGVTKKRRR